MVEQPSEYSWKHFQSGYYSQSNNDNFGVDSLKFSPIKIEKNCYTPFNGLEYLFVNS